MKNAKFSKDLDVLNSLSKALTVSFVLITVLQFIFGSIEGTPDFMRAAWVYWIALFVGVVICFRLSLGYLKFSTKKNTSIVLGCFLLTCLAVLNTDMNFFNLFYKSKTLMAFLAEHPFLLNLHNNFFVTVTALLTLWFGYLLEIINFRQKL